MVKKCNKFKLRTEADKFTRNRDVTFLEEKFNKDLQFATFTSINKPVIRNKEKYISKFKNSILFFCKFVHRYIHNKYIGYFI